MKKRICEEDGSGRMGPRGDGQKGRAKSANWPRKGEKEECGQEMDGQIEANSGRRGGGRMSGRERMEERDEMRRKMKEERKREVLINGKGTMKQRRRGRRGGGDESEPRRVKDVDEGHHGREERAFLGIFP